MRKCLGKTDKIHPFRSKTDRKNHLSSYLHADVYQEGAETSYQIFHWFKRTGLKEFCIKRESGFLKDSHCCLHRIGHVARTYLPFPRSGQNPPVVWAFLRLLSWSRSRFQTEACRRWNSWGLHSGSILARFIFLSQQNIHILTHIPFFAPIFLVTLYPNAIKNE